MRRIIKLSLIFTMALFWIVACSKDSPDPRARFTPEERAKQLKERLDLTDEQAELIKQIYIESDRKMADFRDQFPGPAPRERPERRPGERREGPSEERRGEWMEIRAKMMTIRTETDSLVKAVLFEDQIPEYEAYQEEMRQNFRQRFQQRNQE